MTLNLDEFSAAFLRVKLPHLSAWNARRTLLAQRYLAQLNCVGDLVLPHVPAWAEPVWHLFVVRSAHRDALRAHLTQLGIGTQIHYPIPPHLSGAYRSLGYQRGAFPIAEKLASEVLSLPISPHHTAEQIDTVCEAVRSFFAQR
jgi:dTDP-3-amino-3,4,6-trideoxy-alpha-D-glucose transaminase